MLAPLALQGKTLADAVEEDGLDVRFNRANAKSILHLLPGSVKNALLRTPLEFFLWSESTLIQKAFGEKTPPPTARKLRHRIWWIYNRQVSVLERMSFRDLTSGICSLKHFIDEYVGHPARLAYVFTDPPDYFTEMEDLLYLGIPELRRVLEMKVPVNFKTGIPDIRFMELKFKVFCYVDQRQRGSVVQKIEQKSLNVNVDASQPGGSQNKVQSIDELDKKLAELRARASAGIMNEVQDTIDANSSLTVEQAVLGQGLYEPQLPVEKVNLEAGRTVENFRDYGGDD